jgi:hypothetical protein
MENAPPAVALLQRIADGDRSMSRRQLRRARETVATPVRVQQQTDRLRAAMRARFGTTIAARDASNKEIVGELCAKAPSDKRSRTPARSRPIRLPLRR